MIEYLIICLSLVISVAAGTLLGSYINNQDNQSTKPQANYVCIIHDLNPDLPCRVQMRADVYIQNSMDDAPND